MRQTYTENSLAFARSELEALLGSTPPESLILSHALDALEKGIRHEYGESLRAAAMPSIQPGSKAKAEPKAVKEAPAPSRGPSPRGASSGDRYE